MRLLMVGFQSRRKCCQASGSSRRPSPNCTRCRTRALACGVQMRCVCLTKRHAASKLTTPQTLCIHTLTCSSPTGNSCLQLPSCCSLVSTNTSIVSAHYECIHTYMHVCLQLPSCCFLSHHACLQLFMCCTTRINFYFKRILLPACVYVSCNSCACMCLATFDNSCSTIFNGKLPMKTVPYPWYAPCCLMRMHVPCRI
jgi:hypothetical protein